MIVRAPGAWGSEWGALATRSTPSHGPFRPSASSTFFSAFEVDEPPSQVERISQQQVKLICSGTGKYTVLVWSGVLPYSLSKEVVLPARGKVELEVPPIDAILVGSMNSYGGGKGHSPDHGWAAPRLILLSRKPATNLPREDRRNLQGGLWLRRNSVAAPLGGDLASSGFRGGAAAIPGG